MASRCSPKRFSNVVKNLNDKQRDAVKSIGFGNLLKLNDIRLRRTLINWLIERYCPQTRSFHIQEHEIQVTKMDVALIMGLQVVGTPVNPKHQNHPVDHLVSYYRPRCGQIDVKCLENLLQTTDSDDDFKRTFVLFTLCTLLAPKPRPEVSTSFLRCVADTKEISTYAWGEFVLENLFIELDVYKREGHKYIGGCIVLLQFWYYEHILVPIEGLSAEPKKFPRLSEWDGSRCLNREKKEARLGGYGFGEIIDHISPTPVEASYEEVKVLLAPELHDSFDKDSDGREADDVHSMTEGTKPLQEKDLMIVSRSIVAVDPPKESDTSIRLPNMAGNLSIIRCTKKQKICPDIHDRIASLECIVEEQRNKYEELNQKLSSIERAFILSDDHDGSMKTKEDRITALELIIEQQKKINEELRQRLNEVERVVALPKNDSVQTGISNTDNH